jgi:putative FmdB family regulatory protein
MAMPTYEYACSKCGEHLEAVQSFSDEPLKKCPACGGRLKKVFGAVGIVFKGSGFYKTDSRSSTKSTSSTSDKATSEKSTTSESSTSDSKATSSESSSSSKDSTTSTKASSGAGSKAAAS